MTRVLIVEDEAGLRRALAINLRAHGYTADAAPDGAAALQAAAHQPPDAIVLDLGLPDMDGVAVIEGLRGWSQVPILVLSARGSEHDKVLALDAGADDYVTKPFGLAELRSRIHAVLRRADPRTFGNHMATVGRVTLDRANRVVSIAGDPVDLTFSEFELLSALIGQPGRLFSRQELLRAIWGDSAYRDPRAIDVHVRHLREKLEEVPESPSLIITVRGAGYRLNVP